MKLLGSMLMGFVLGPVLLVAAAYVFAFPWHFAALAGGLVMLMMIFALANHLPDDADPAMPPHDPDRAAVDLLKPGQ